MILKKGSKGSDVKTLQEFIGITADGDFGYETEKYVKKWQSNHGLTPDGIIGPKTWDEMGLATTDNSEQIYTTSNGLIIEKHFLPSGEYKVGPTSKEYVFLHHTAGWHKPINCIDSWGRDSRGTVATEFVIGGQSIKGNDDNWDGVTVQAFPEGGYGWHLGKNGSQYMHTHSVGIEVCNFGYIENGKTYAGTTADKGQIVTLTEEFRGHRDWHRYSNKQIESLKKWILYIADRDNIDVRDGLVSEIRKNGAGGFEFNENAYYGKTKGMWTHTNVRKDKTDLYPCPRLIDMLLSL